VPEVLSQPELDQIVQYFLDLPQKCKTIDIKLPDRPALFVKYGNKDLLAEATLTQSFFHALARKDPSAPGIPAIYNAFCGNGYYFIVMEKVDLPTLEDCNFIPDDYAIQHVASAIGWLLAQMPAVPPSLFGRISASEACVWHAFFKDHEVPVPFVSSKVLTKYVNKALSHHQRNMILPISLSNDLLLYHSDICKDNFLIDVTTGHICIVDLQHIGMLPKPFQQYAFFHISIPFASAIGRLLGHQPSSIVEVMTNTSCLLQQTAAGRLGKYLSSFMGT
ncbi:hypothetical protein K439DRAFT_1361046, partial [Ramaria rubella]